MEELRKELNPKTKEQMKNKKTEYQLFTASTVGIFLILLFLSIQSQAQCLSVINGSKSNPFNYQKQYSHFYLNGSTNILKLEDEGIDFDIEAGYMYNRLVGYGFYGEFREYYNYGLGLDYRVYEWKPVELFLGANAGGISVPSELTVDNVHYFSYAVRSKALIRITNMIGLSITGQFQQRKDLPDNGVVELMGGIQFKIK